MGRRCPSNHAFGQLSSYLCCRQSMRQCCRPTSRAKIFAPRRWLSSAAGHYDNRVAVIGAGITGLSAAYHLSQNKSTHVTLYEKSPRLGGWLQSETIEVLGGKVVFEYGPRTIRVSPWETVPTLSLINDLNIGSDKVQIKKTSPIARNRYIYYPDRLIRIPGSLADPIGRTIWGAMLRDISYDLFHSRRVRDSDFDESVASFVSRRVGQAAADNIVSAAMHGIYAGDIDQLSARALLAPIWELQFQGRGGLLWEHFHRRIQGKRFYLHDVRQYVSLASPDKGPNQISMYAAEASYFSILMMKHGMGQITSALESSLRSAHNVTICTGVQIEQISMPRNKNGMNVKLAGSTTSQFDNVISSTPSSALAKQLRSGTTTPTLTTKSIIQTLEANNSAVSVMVVNLFYKSPELVPVKGFGYLIPRSIPFGQNPERALGVIFGNGFPEQDTVYGTKLTVMLGGHWWNGWDEADFPDELSGIEMAKTLLQRHLGIIEEPLVAKARLQRDAIPQYTVGHVTRMQDLVKGLTQEFYGKLNVAGAWYSGVGINDCTRAGYMAASTILDGSNHISPLVYRYLHNDGEMGTYVGRA